MEEIQVALTQLFSAAVVAILGVVTAQISGWIKSSKLAKHLESKTESVRIAVNAVEQIAKNEGIEDKFTEAKTRALEILNSNGLKFTEDELNSLIEIAVREIKNSAKGE